MLRVIGAGLPRTGTTSMKAALERLGYAPCYHMAEVMTHPDHVDRWLSVTSGGISTRAEWDGVFAGGYQAAQDWPASHYYRELAEAYPEAKVLLTVRDPHKWYLSIRMLMSGPSALGLSDGDEIPEPMRPIAERMQRLTPAMEAIGRQYFGQDWHYGDDLTDEDAVVAAYERHVATVRSSIPADRLLVFDVREGWEPLCAFLGVEAPEDEPFPHLNDGDSMRRTLEQIVTGGLTSFPPGLGSAPPAAGSARP